MERDEILTKLRERIIAFVASRVRRDGAEDVAHEVLLLLEEKYPHVTALEELVPLSMRIARFKITALYRKATRRGEGSAVSVDEIPLPDFAPDPETLTSRRELLDRIRAALPQVGQRCRDLLRLKLEGKSFSEIRKAMGAHSLNTVYTWDYRCRRHLLELIGGSWEIRK
ncbi:MAG: sigma-70 family RNA polymerase sigma factor [Bryobacteraceae bacterium]|nr:sigma-70 family RNA polymerase sigma factor [Bryobacteraceae bacterium]